MAAALIPERLRPQMALGEIIAFAYDTFCSNKVRFILTALGMVIGTASLILVVTIGMTGRQFVLNQIQAIGTNEIWAEYLGGAPHISNSNPDPLTIDDLHAVQEVVPGIVASSPVSQLSDRVPVGNGKEKDVTILGVNPEYVRVRNLVVPSGRFFDQRGFAGPQQSRSNHREDGGRGLRIAAGRSGQSHQADGTSLHHHRDFQRAGRNLRAIRDRR